MIWPDPVPCRPSNPVQGIRQCEALRTGSLCRWLKVRYCGVRADEMLDAFELLGLEEFSWLLEDDAEADDIADVLPNLSEAIARLRPAALRQEDSLRSARWFAGLLRASSRYGCGLSGRFEERLGTKDRY